MNTSYTITLDNVSLGYNTNIILENITTTIPTGKITFIIGGSGSGKSTLLRSLIGLLPPLTGSIRFNNEELYSKQQQRTMHHTMGVLFQDGALLENLTVAENIALVLEQNTRYSRKKINTEIARVLENVFLPHTQNKYPSELSGGMRKRVALARAIVLSPPIILCDEPTSGLDPILASEMDELLLNMKEDMPTSTILIISHNMQSLKKMAEYTILLHSKKVYFQGETQELLHSTDSYTQQFISP